MVGGAAAFVVIAKFADIAPAGMTTVGGTDATVESLLNSNAVVGAGSGKASGGGGSGQKPQSSRCRHPHECFERS